MRQVTGDLLTAPGLIVHGCNAQGIMEAGVALAIKQKWPQVFNTYQKRHLGLGLALGFVVFVPVGDGSGVVVANAITQAITGTGLQVDYAAIRACFAQVAKVARLPRLPVHYPKIGAGLGGGDWTIIAQIIEDELEGLDHTLWVLEP